MGGDEFIICLTQLSHVNDVHTTLKKILESLNQAYTFLGGHTHITASAGVSIYPNDGIDANQLFKNADAAMYHAKASGRNQFQFFVEQKNNR
ncbi:MAG: GGDEF domain-containing protein [Burkholderiaceae bacterium]|nr:GGDEF domain-containing protein [Burkholderiaceae bacterium]